MCIGCTALHRTIASHVHCRHLPTGSWVSLHCCERVLQPNQDGFKHLYSAVQLSLPRPGCLLEGIAAPSKAPEGSQNAQVDAAAGKGQDSDPQKGQGSRPPQFGDSAHLLDGIKLVAAKSGSTIKLSE